MENVSGGSMEDTSGNNKKPVSFAEAFDKEIADAIEAIKPGRIVKGKVVQIDSDFVHVDVDYKSVGAVPKEEFYNIENELTVKLGDLVDVYVLALEDDDNQILLSHERATQIRVWKEVEEKFNNGGMVTGRVQHKVKGGLQVDIGIPAFLPGSQVDLKPHKSLDKFIGKVYDFKVLKITKEKGNIVVSRRSLLQSEREEMRTETLKAIEEGVVLEGTVKNVTDYGAFVDLGGIDGLLHITDISWGHLEHPSDRISVGEKVKVVVLSYEEEKQRVSLGIKQLTEDPWDKIPEKYIEGQKIHGKVVGTGEFGVHLELEENIDGYIHVDDLSWTKKVKIGKNYPKGKEVEVLILGVDAEERKISLSVKHLEDNPWDSLHERFPVGSKVKGKIRSITDFGIFVGVEEGIDGLVHLSDISWTEKYSSSADIKKQFNKGDDIEAQVLGIKPEEERLSLGIKHLENDPWPAIVQRYPVGTKVKGKVIGIAQFGLFVQLEEQVEGLVHKTLLGIGKKPMEEAFHKGQDIEAIVISVDVDSEDRRIGLSIKDLKRRAREEAIESFNDDGAGPTLGELFKEQLGGE